MVRASTRNCQTLSFFLLDVQPNVFRAQVTRRTSDNVEEADKPREADDTVTWGETGSRPASVIKGFLADSRSPRQVAFEFLGQPCDCQRCRKHPLCFPLRSSRPRRPCSSVTR